jgi:2,3-bisphosphoglycerate-dependent phosphoglycerate mutase
VPIIKHELDDVNWHGWDHYEGDASQELPIYLTAALDERYYGQLQGLDKLKIAQEYGAEQIHLWRRSFYVRPPGGESLEDTQKRVLPYFSDRIMTHIRQGDNVLVSAHGNSLRAIIMELDKLSPDEVTQLELGTGIPIVYDFDEQGIIQTKMILNT